MFIENQVNLFKSCMVCVLTTNNQRCIFVIELLIGTRESKDPRVQAGLAGPSPLQRTRETRQMASRALFNDCFGQFTAELCALVAVRGVKTRLHSSQCHVRGVKNNAWSKLITCDMFLACLVVEG